MMAKSIRQYITVIFLLFLTSCDASTYKKARQIDQIDAYQRYIHRYPKGKYRLQALEHISRLKFQSIEKKPSILAYRRFLTEFPRSIHKKNAQKAIAKLLFERAKTHADYQLIIETYPDSPYSRRARQKLMVLDLSVIEKNPTIETCERFLSSYPKSKDVFIVEQKLARLELAKLTPTINELEQFLYRFSHLPIKIKAQNQLKFLLKDKIVRFYDQHALAHYRSRFPKDPQLAPLLALMTRAKLASALLDLNIKTLNRLSEKNKGLLSTHVTKMIKKLINYCEHKAFECAQSRDMIRAAQPFRPSMSPQAISLMMNSANLRDLWRAFHAASYYQDREMGTLLFEQLSKPNLGTIYPAYRSLISWMEKLSPRSRTSFLRRHKKHSTICLISDIPCARKTSAIQTYQHQILKAFINNQKQGTSSLKTIFPLATNRLRRLKTSIPSQITKDNFTRVQLIEEELFVLNHLLSRLKGAKRSIQLRNLMRNTQLSLNKIRIDLLRINSNFKPSQFYNFSNIVNEHRRNRFKAMQQALNLKPRSLFSIVGHVFCHKYGHEISEIKALQKECLSSRLKKGFLNNKTGVADP